MSTSEESLCGASYHPLSKDEDAPPLMWLSSDHKRLVLGVFDGMGGRGALPVTWQGQKRSMAFIASRWAKSALEISVKSNHLLTRHVIESSLKRRFTSSSLPQPDTKLKLQRGSLYPTTVAIAEVISHHEGYISVSCWWAGDSRVYHYTPQAGLRSLTTDHAREPGVNSSPLTQWISTTAQEVDEYKTNVSGGLILLCSDGLYNSLSTYELNQFIAKLYSDPSRGYDLLRQTLQKAHQTDDITLAWVKLNIGGLFKEVEDPARTSPQTQAQTQTFSPHSVTKKTLIDQLSGAPAAHALVNRSSSTPVGRSSAQPLSSELPPSSSASPRPPMRSSLSSTEQNTKTPNSDHLDSHSAVGKQSTYRPVYSKYSPRPQASRAYAANASVHRSSSIPVGRSPAQSPSSQLPSSSSASPRPLMTSSLSSTEQNIKTLNSNDQVDPSIQSRSQASQVSKTQTPSPANTSHQAERQQSHQSASAAAIGAKLVQGPALNANRHKEKNSSSCSNTQEIQKLQRLIESLPIKSKLRWLFEKDVSFLLRIKDRTYENVDLIRFMRCLTYDSVAIKQDLQPFPLLDTIISTLGLNELIYEAWSKRFLWELYTALARNVNKDSPVNSFKFNNKTFPISLFRERFEKDFFKQKTKR